MENFSKFMIKVKPQIQEDQRTPKQDEYPENHTYAVGFEVQKTTEKEKSLQKEEGRKLIMYREARKRIALDFSLEIVQARRRK